MVNVDKVQVDKQTEDTTSTGTILFTEEGDTLTQTIFKIGECANESKITKAKETEMNSLQEFGVYTEVKDCGQSTISTRWVVTEKGEKVKARLVARGFEDYFETKRDSPTVTKPSLRILFCLCASYGWKIESLDITSAFLQSDKMDRDVYIKPPADFRKRGLIWKLIKPLYGLGESARLWYLTLKKHLLELGCEISKMDKSLFIYYENNKLQGLIVTHVDDMLYCGSGRFKQKIILCIFKIFKISRTYYGIFTYLGCDVHQKKDCITVDQNCYAKNIQSIAIEAHRRKEKEADLTSEEIKDYQGLLGKLLWISSQTRPDLSFDVLEHSTYTKSPKIKHAQSLNKVIKRIDGGLQMMCFRNLNIEKDNLYILFFSDASLGNLPDGKGSARGYLVFLTNGTVANLLAWSSKKIKRVVHSVFGAETFACIDGSAAAIYIRQLLSEILFKDPRKDVIPIIGVIDSNQLRENLTSSSQCQDKRLVLDIGELQETIQSGEINKIVWVRTQDMLADVLTKKGVCCDNLSSIIQSGYGDFEHFVRDC